MTEFSEFTWYKSYCEEEVLDEHKQHREILQEQRDLSMNMQKTLDWLI